jgi:hypothetical protein
MKSNMEVIRNYLSGERPYIKVAGFEEKPHIIRKTGDVWTDDNGYVWEQKDGYVIKSTRMGKLIKETLGEKICPNCQKNIKWSSDRADERSFNGTGKCFDCNIKFESDLRILGKWPDYQKKQVLLSQKSMIRDIKVRLDEAHEYFEDEKNLTFVNSNGLVEEWPNTVRKQTQKAINKDLKKAVKYLAEIDEMIKELTHV